MLEYVERVMGQRWMYYAAPFGERKETLIATATLSKHLIGIGSSTGMFGWSLTDIDQSKVPPGMQKCSGFSDLCWHPEAWNEGRQCMILIADEHGKRVACVLCNGLSRNLCGAPTYRVMGKIVEWRWICGSCMLANESNIRMNMIFDGRTDPCDGPILPHLATERSWRRKVEPLSVDLYSTWDGAP